MRSPFSDRALGSTNAIDHINLSRLDLNLLPAFDALLSEGSVTRAAKCIGIGRPSMSHVLNRLRRLFRDDLFIRAPVGIRPAPGALRLAGPIREALSMIQGTLLQGESFDPLQPERVFLLGMPDSVEVPLLPRLMALLASIAPRVRIQVRAIDRFTILELLDGHRLHLRAAGLLTEGSNHHKRRRLHTTNDQTSP
ncbi:LysR family transcriptional regulator [Bosea sp. 2YAB26]|uniref:LysR family transcriptional regulator n=1 Tax=Bosea sp. 2YAB26 TaxID=3237478 RepID=UPI003F90709C